MFVRVNKVDGIPDDNGGKGGWWTVNVGVHDEGRPGRKSKGKKRNSGEAVEDVLDGDMKEEHPSQSTSVDRDDWPLDSTTAVPAPSAPSTLDEKRSMLEYGSAGLGLSVDMAPPQYVP